MTTFNDGQVLTAAELNAAITMLTAQIAPTFATIPENPQGIFLVLADETKSGAPTLYLFTTSHRYWIAMVQDA
jgi:hypothetical protein